MKTKGVKTLLIVFLGLFMTLPAFTQNSDNNVSWKENEVCLKNLSLYYEYYKHKNYRDAIGPWRIVFNECPESRESLYAYGVNMYRDFLEKENDPAKKAAYADTIMMVYDQRIEYFPKNKGDVLGRKGIDLLRYRRQDGIEYIEQGYNILKESIEIEGRKSNPVILTTFISAAITLNLNDKLDPETVIEDYVVASDIIDAQLARRPSGRTKKAKEAIDENIKEAKVLTCESINTIFGPQYEENKDNKEYLKKVTGFLQDANCEFEPLYAKTAVSL